MRKFVIAYLAGALRDASVDRKSVQIFSSSREWLKNIQRLLLLEGIESKIYGLKRGCWKLKISRKRIGFILKLVEFRSPQVKWKTPAWIKSLAVEIKKWYIAGFFDAEGCVSLSQRKYLNLEFYQSNPLILRDLRNFLLSMKIKTTRITKKKNRNLFCLRITDQGSVFRFSRNIPLLHPKKLEKLFSHTKAP